LLSAGGAWKTTARGHIENPNVTHGYHSISRCVCRVFLFAENQDFDRNAWLDKRLKQLNPLFADSVVGFRVMDNHLHLLLRIEPETASAG
jgi:REP element-mobilizing transposase RayT